MEDIILDDAASLTNIIESQAKSGPITNLSNIVSIAVINSLWTIVAGQKYVIYKYIIYIQLFTYASYRK